MFAGEGSHLERYARLLTCSEINSSFYRPPMLSTWRKWAEAVPDGFQFSVKAPKAITHEGKLACEPEVLENFLSGATLLGAKLGPILFQLPPKLTFDKQRVVAFLEMLRSRYAGSVVLEPRNASWFSPAVADLLRLYRIARVAADPAKVPEAQIPGGWGDLIYYRLHGSPRTYYSAYSAEYLAQLAQTLANKPEAWVIFDNTASGAAISNALELAEMVQTRTA